MIARNLHARLARLAFGLAESTGATGRLGERAIEKGYLTPEQLREGLREQIQSSGKFMIGQILLRKKRLTPEQLVALLGLHDRYSLICTHCGRKYQILKFTNQSLWCLFCGQALLLSRSAEELTQPDHRIPCRLATRPDRPGLWIGRYQILREVARGGMGVVFEATDLELNRRIALKILKEGEAHADSIRRLHREAILASRLQHPNIVRIHETGVADGTHYISMDFVEGPTLASQIQEGELVVRDAVTILTHVSDAIAYAHQQGILHRDLKPGNILLDPERGPVITDFGLAKDIIKPGVLTVPGAQVGTPRYMAPEQVEGGEVGPATDVYALGAILYEALTGRRSFDGSTITALQQSIIQDDPIPPARLRPAIDADLERVCLKCLAKQPAWRYPSAGELKDELERWLHGNPTRTKPIGWATQIYRKIRQNVRFMAMIGMILVMMFMDLSIIFWTEHDQSIRERHTRLLREAQWIEEHFRDTLLLREGITLLETCLAEDPANNEVRLLKAQFHRHLSEMEAALKECRHVIRIEPRSLKGTLTKLMIEIEQYISSGDPATLPARTCAIQLDIDTLLKLGGDPEIEGYWRICREYVGQRCGVEESLRRCEQAIRSGWMVSDYRRLENWIRERERSHATVPGGCPHSAASVRPDPVLLTVHAQL